MPDENTANSETSKENNVQPVTNSTEERIPSTVLSGAEKLLDGGTHTGLAVLVTSDGKPSTLMIPDIKGVKEKAITDTGGNNTQTGGLSPVYITKPIRIHGDNLINFLKAKKIDLPAQLENFISGFGISCEAFYYTQNGPLLMMFELRFDIQGQGSSNQGGLIGNLTGDEDLSKLFDIQGAAVRILRCSENSFEVLRKYADELSA